MNLLLVESPAKAKTIGQWLNKNQWIILPTVGHIKNLPKDDYGIDKENDYEGTWVIEKDKKDILKNIKNAITRCSKIFIATDDDRQGERIAFDIVEHFNLKEYYRILFHEITKKGVSDSLRSAVYIDEHKVRSQMTGRLIDRTIGYPFSQALRWYLKQQKLATDNQIKKVGLGRVSALALAIIVRNQRIVDDFVPEKYRKIYIEYQYKGESFTVTDQSKFRDEDYESLQELYALCSNPDTIHRVDDYEDKDTPTCIQAPAPLTTTTLVRGVNFLYSFSPKEIEKAFQKLFTGIEIINPMTGYNERVGLITYPRTDNVFLSDTIIGDIIECLSNVFDSEFILTKKRVYKKNKNSKTQDAHESIRPTNFAPGFFPKRLKTYLTEIEYRVYEFIFYRTIATQMKDSIYDRSKLTIDVGGKLFTVKANRCIFKGWEALGNIVKKQDDRKEGKVVTLPKELYIDDVIKPFSVIVSDDKTDQTPPRIGQGRFIKILESHYIGKSSTITTISEGLVEKGYINVTENMIEPTQLGHSVIETLEDKSPWLVDIEHGRIFEEKLTEIQEGADIQVELIKEYDTLVNEFMQLIGYEYKGADKSAEQWMIDKAERLSEANGLELDISLLNDKKQLLTYIKKLEKISYVGKCPVCNNEVHEREKTFSCKNMDCKFTIWKNSIDVLLENFKKGLSRNRYKELIKQLLQVKKIWVNDLYSKKKQNTFNAYFILSPTDNNSNFYQISLDFPKVKPKTIHDKYIFQFDDSLFAEPINNTIIEQEYIDISGFDNNVVNNPKRQNHSNFKGKQHNYGEPIVTEFVSNENPGNETLADIPSIL